MDNPNNNWTEYQYYVLKTIAELKEEVEHNNVSTQESLQDIRDTLHAIQSRLQYLEHDHKWHSKIAASVAGLLAFVASWLIK